jgi:hypothetical protein
METDNMKNCYRIMLLIFVLASCASPAEITPMPKTESVLTSFVATETATFNAASMTNTVAPATTTPFPTVMPSEATKFIDELVSTNEICSFPCWGGIIPGETNWANISAFLASFAEVSKHSPSSPKGYAVYIPLPNQYPKDLLWLSVYLNEKSTVKYINGRRYYLPIDQLLNQYGKPNQIYLFILGILPSDNVEQFDILLSYEKQGFFVVYNGETQNQSLLEVCPSNVNGDPYFWLWNPRENGAMSTIVNGGSSYRFSDDWTKFKEIATTTSEEVSVDSFYETYTNPATVDVCFRIPSSSVP